MSFDLVVFQPDAAPKDAAGFLAWYQQLRAAAPREAGPALRSWRREMEERGGPFSAHMTRDSICASFGWDMSTEVFETAFELAGQHEVGLFDPQAGTRWLPNGNRGLFQWNEEQAQSGTSADAVAVANSFLDSLCKSGDLEADEEGDWDELTRGVAAVLDRARRRSPIPDLWRLFLGHDAVGELYINKAQLKAQLDGASERVLGHPPSSETGWV